MKNVKVEALKSINNLICSTGRVNAYRMAFYSGLGASCRDETWNKNEHIHECCGSKQPWRHKATCTKAVRNAPDDLSDLRDF